MAKNKIKVDEIEIKLDYYYWKFLATVLKEKVFSGFFLL